MPPDPTPVSTPKHAVTHSLMPRRAPSIVPRSSFASSFLQGLLATVFALVSWATLPLRVIARILFARTRRMPMSMADEINYLAPRVTSAVEGRAAKVMRTTSSELMAEIALSALKCAIGKAPSVVVPAALSPRLYPSHYLVPFQGQPHGYLSPASPVISERMLEVQYGEKLHDMRREAARALGSKLRKGLVLDLGAGAGTFLRTLRSEHYLTRLFGIELSPYMIAAAYAHQLDGLDDHVEMVEANITSLPFDDASARGITACFVLHEMPERATKAALKEVVRVLEPGGRFVVLDCSTPSSHLSRITARIRARVFYQPYRQAYLSLDLQAYLGKLGLHSIEQRALHSDVSLLVFEKPALAN